MINNKIFDGIIAFSEVVRLGSFSEAAQSIGCSSAHVSKEVSRLEDRVGVRLLNRTTRSVSLTPDGQAYYERCRELISEAESAFNLITQQDERPRGRLKVSCPIGIGHSYIQPVISDYLSKYPNVSLDWNLSDERTDLIAGGYDLAIRAAPSLDESSLICRKIYSCKSHIVAAPSFLEKYGKPFHPKELVNFNCICYSNLNAPKRWEFNGLNGEHFVVDVRDYVRCNNGDLEIALTKAGLGICYLPSFYMQDAIERGELEILFPDYPMPDINVYAIYPSRKHLSAKVRTFIDMLVEAFDPAS